MTIIVMNEDRFTAFIAPNRNLKTSLIIHLHRHPICSLFLGRRGKHLPLMVTYLSEATFLVLIQKENTHSADSGFRWMKLLLFVNRSLNKSSSQFFVLWFFGHSVDVCVFLSDVLSFSTSVILSVFIYSVRLSARLSVCLSINICI